MKVGSMAFAAVDEVELADGAKACVRVLAPSGVAGAPGTPMAVTYEPAPVVVLGAPEDETAANELLAPLSSARSRILLSAARKLEAGDVAECMSRCGVTQAHLLGLGDGAAVARAFREALPYRVLSLCCDGPAEASTLFARNEPERHHRPLVTVENGMPRVMDAPASIVVRKATMADEQQILAMYDHLLDACDVPGKETCGWLRGYWPLPDDVSRRLAAGETWAAFDAVSSEPGSPVLGAMSLDGDFGLSGTNPDWEELAEDEFLTCHLLATDPAAHGKGVATALLCAYAREAVARGCKAIRINTSPQSLSNLLYHKLGFELHKPLWFPYEGLDISGWTNIYEIRLDR